MLAISTLEPTPACCHRAAASIPIRQAANARAPSRKRTPTTLLRRSRAAGQSVHASWEMWSTVQAEFREVAWIVSVVFSLSVLGVALAVAVALA